MQQKERVYSGLGAIVTVEATSSPHQKQLQAAFYDKTSHRCSYWLAKMAVHSYKAIVDVLGWYWQSTAQTGDYHTQAGGDPCALMMISRRRKVSPELLTIGLDDKPEANQEGFEVIEWCCHGSLTLPIPPSNVGDADPRIRISDPQCYLRRG
jgi:hypothetical protein